MNATHEAVDAVFREEGGAILASLIRACGDFDLAQDALQDAVATALERWPREGVPRNAAAWLTTSARHRAIDRLRRNQRLARKLQTLGGLLDEAGDEDAPSEAPSEDGHIADDRLRLIFTCCHPALAPEAQVALTLRTLCGLTTAEIARAFLVPEPTMAQRIVRAKKTLSEAKVPYEVPAGAELGERLASVLEVVYLIFNEGYAATAGEDWVRPGLCEEALRLGRILAARASDEPEVHGLVALMELQASRFRARVGPDGEPILLLDQNRARWDRLLIGRGLAALERAQQLAGAGPGPYLLQAALAACHARARTAEETDWKRIVALYTVLGQVTPSPVVELNRAVAVSMADGPAAGLALVEALAGEPALKRYHLLPGVRGDLLAKLGRHREAAEAFEHAVALTQNARERALMEERAAKGRAADS
jgi:RNA polymerase sigma factor (sigma-70 family)